MTNNYDTETLKDIVAEAKRQGYDDPIIALNLGICRDHIAFGYAGDDQLRAIISERLRRGEHRLNIAQDMGMTLAELIRIEGNPSLRVGLDSWTACHVDPSDPYHEENILHLVERGRASLKSAHTGGLLSPEEVLALLVDTVGLSVANEVIAAATRITEDMNVTAETLRIPLDAIKAVVWGSFPTINETRH
jgi:hypothetical protein